MDNFRVILFAALFGLSFLAWQAWEQDYNPTPVSTHTQQNTRSQTEAVNNDDGSMPQLPNSVSDNQADPSVPQLATSRATAEYVSVFTDLYEARISLMGGEIVYLALQEYPETLEDKTNKVELLSTKLPYYFVAQTGLAADEQPSATHKTLFAAQQRKYQMSDRQNTLDVPLTWQQDGILITKTYRFTRDRYIVGIDQQITNNSAAAWSGSQYSQFQRTAVAPESEAPFVQTFLGAAVYEQKEADEYRFTKLEFDDLIEESYKKDMPAGWIGMVQHYFVGAIVPPKDGNYQYRAKPLQDGRYLAGFVSKQQVVQSGQQHTFSHTLFLGPKIQDQLQATAPGLNLTVDYGILTIISEPLFWLLSKIQGFVGNWGIAIFLITLLIKLMFYKISEAQYRSMAKMRLFAPKIKSLKERYGDDKQKMQQAMMKLYKEEKFNPLGGCWPMLVQIPVFIALYWVLLESVELRQAPLFGWINDLSVADPFYVLPVLLGGAMFLQQKMSSSTMTMDPMQAKIMNLMPLMMTAFFAFFPAGLVVYWLANTLLGILQQWIINKRIDKEADAKKLAKR